MVLAELELQFDALDHEAEADDPAQLPDVVVVGRLGTGLISGRRLWEDEGETSPCGERLGEPWWAADPRRLPPLTR